MKRILLALIFGFLFLGCDLNSASTYNQSREANSQITSALVTSQSTIPVPSLSYFQERRTIAKWATHWDRPSAACYVYLVSYGQIIGYYVSDGKPASTNSFLTPSYREDYRGEGGAVNTELPDIDGCYGENNPGIRFFTASGIAVEWAGDGASYIYSDAPLQINAPLLGK